MPKTLIAAALLSLLVPAAIAQESPRIEINKQAPIVAHSEIYIDAALAAVWSVLADIDSWTSYMPEFASARLDGPMQPGTMLLWEPQGQYVESRLVAVETDKLLVWNGSGGAVHVWELTSSGSGTVLRNDESIDDAAWSAGPTPEAGSEFLTQSLSVWDDRIAEQVKLTR
ncbi:Polyketide cyclase / dehydrase and lipid transport [Devosia sp. YR412]|uniref:SRPBCC family protein n=1 Tax=Devosia sp. YR412 TaxID=1881030 RepID=UPI0008C53BA5|nr:SRPBCC family protein [Devosia sp. YR412]SEQ09392.1 Polyketide cyclase / dehydrase and lipid transport [Devosia sp. YR412]